ncbi:WYL domain-containing protein [Tissierella sp. MB52-C2]|uniref:helix-turn-helix transcriptional regulator n=1 Tax=Tissierella sp. MB52-C2 TaxID=3070999 RepID=UPI00280BA14B|nr:WYL domain-containing protein [Tissierella sp. MB52-C2]WMM24890.1 WYL domain-containing protein [Tissierella sp. MB52-C2]
MKADRLISILMLLQIHKQLTASELAQRLEVSVRTIYRDIEALSGAGVPIFADRGTNGGIKLLGDYKTSLSGINNDEIYSLFIPTGDKILEDLGFEKLKYSTILKLLGGSAPNQIKEVENIQNYIYIDMHTWNENPAIVDKNILSLLQNAIWNSNIIKIVYRKTNEIKEVILNPLGLVCKRGIWYLIAIDAEIIKTYRVSSIESALFTDEHFNRPSDFNLEAHWKSSVSNYKSRIPKYTFTFIVDPWILNHIKERKFITISKELVRDNKIYLDIVFEDIWQGIEFAFAYGKNIRIIKPVEAINEIKTKATEIIQLYK